MRDKFSWQWGIGSSMFNDYYQLPGYRPLGRSIYPQKDGKSAGGMGSWQLFHKVC